ncbi:MAG: ribonuclease HI [Rhodospirillaceae bacterium]|nr:ribonuclease HI [Rhodospirillaceae bacterium]MDE0363579.1 ribonuclease HI [Rhodospirillaceae bacterium]
MKAVTAYTDGACRGNPGPGGWGAILRYGENFREMQGGEPQTTNNRMELKAAIEALGALREPCRVTLYTDSRYVRDGITRWLPDWRRRDWLTRAKKPVKNKDLWVQLDDLAQHHEVVWHWVKGHDGHPGNERADALANLGLEQALTGEA